MRRLSYVYNRILPWKGEIHTTMWREILREIIRFLTEKMKGTLTGRLDKVIGNLKNNYIRNIGAALASGRYMDAINKTPLPFY